MNNRLNSAQRGFTLIEMIVAVGIFMTVVLIASGALLLLVDSQRKAFALRETYDNLRFAMETIAKDLRTGAAYHCGGSPPPLYEAADCSVGDSRITYTNSKKQQVTYILNPASKRIEKIIGTDSCPVAGACDLTSSDVVIERLSFYVVGSDITDQIHPRVTAIMTARAGSGRSSAIFTLQTTITQRILLQ